jgi:hypothetical protein
MASIKPCPGPKYRLEKASDKVPTASSEGLGNNVSEVPAAENAYAAEPTEVNQDSEEAHEASSYAEFPLNHHSSPSLSYFRIFSSLSCPFPMSSSFLLITRYHLFLLPSPHLLKLTQTLP